MPGFVFPANNEVLLLPQQTPNVFLEFLLHIRDAPEIRSHVGATVPRPGMLAAGIGPALEPAFYLHLHIRLVLPEKLANVVVSLQIGSIEVVDMTE